jgi:hypothetical protein
MANARTRLRKGGKMTNGTRTFEYSIRKTKTCPVCGESSYSKDGIHPQCAVQLADESRKEQLHAARKASQAQRAKTKIMEQAMSTVQITTARKKKRV